MQLSASFVQREVARDSVTEGLFLLKSSAILPSLCHPERSESGVEPVGRCKASGSLLGYIVTLFLKTKTRKPLTRSLRCYAPWFARFHSQTSATLRMTYSGKKSFYHKCHFRRLFLLMLFLCVLFTPIIAPRSAHTIIIAR